MGFEVVDERVDGEVGEAVVLSPQPDRMKCGDFEERVTIWLSLGDKTATWGKPNQKSRNNFHKIAVRTLDFSLSQGSQENQIKSNHLIVASLRGLVD